MTTEIIKEFNWIDIFIVIIIFRTGYIALKKGIQIEAFKFLGTVLAVYLSLHYYIIAADFLRQNPIAQKLPKEFLDLVSFVSLAVIGYVIFLLLRNIFEQFMKGQAVTNFYKWAGLFCGLMRGYLLCGLIIFIFALSGVGYLLNSAKHSYLGKQIFSVAPHTYDLIRNTVTSKIFTAEKYNQAVTEVQSNFTK